MPKQGVCLYFMCTILHARMKKIATIAEAPDGLGQSEDHE